MKQKSKTPMKQKVQEGIKNLLTIVIENQKGITDHNIKKIDETEIKSKKQQAQIRFYTNGAYGLEIIKNIIMAYVTTNQKSYNIALDNLNLFEEDYKSDRFVMDLTRDSNDHCQTELENFLSNRLDDKYLIFTSKLNFIRYNNKVQNLIQQDQFLVQEAKEFFKNNKYKDIIVSPPN